jgi:hypothetical protein
MNVLIQNQSTGMYYGGKGQWVSAEKHAQVFNSTTAALHYCLERESRDIVLVVRFLNSALNFTIAPFTEDLPQNAGCYSAFAKVVVENARQIVLAKKALELWRELDGIISVIKEKRKGGKRSSTGDKREEPRPGGVSENDNTGGKHEQ